MTDVLYNGLEAAITSLLVHHKEQYELDAMTLPDDVNIITFTGLHIAEELTKKYVSRISLLQKNVRIS